jgi:isoleucyl-tRNA synthetase
VAYEADLPGLFIVSQVAFDAGDEKSVKVERADGLKCERCWKYSVAVGQDEEFPTVCDTCAAALREMNG